MGEGGGGVGGEEKEDREAIDRINVTPGPNLHLPWGRRNEVRSFLKVKTEFTLTSKRIPLLLRTALQRNVKLDNTRLNVV